MKKDLIIFHEYIPKVGGIESAVFYLGRALQRKFNVRILFNSVENPETVLRYGEFIEIEKNNPRKTYDCDTLLLASNFDEPRNIFRDTLIQWVHSDYKKYRIKLCKNDVDYYVAVSENAAKSFWELYGKECIVIQNYLDPDFAKWKKPQLKFVTNSRLSSEKGWDRMVQFCKGLRENNVTFSWTIYGDNSHNKIMDRQIREKFEEFSEVLFVGFKNEVRNGLLDADYLVQLSDFEGCPYAVLEALAMKTPCILTSFPSAHELIQEGKNGYIVPLSMKGVDYQRFLEVPKQAKLDQKNLLKKWEKIIENT